MAFGWKWYDGWFQEVHCKKSDNLFMPDVCIYYGISNSFAMAFCD